MARRSSIALALGGLLEGKGEVETLPGLISPLMIRSISSGRKRRT